MSDDRKEIEKILQRLKQLSQRQMELSEAHQQQFFLYRWLQRPDPELQSVKDEIARLDKDEENYFKILQAAASISPPVEEKDWSHVPFYWKRLTKFGLITPAEQIKAYSTFAIGIVGLGHAVTNFCRAHHLFQVTKCKEKTEEWNRHWANARDVPLKMKSALYWARKYILRGSAALGAPFLLIYYIWSK